MQKIFATPAEVRLACRRGDFSAQTSGQAPGFAQANLCILPSKYAYDFLLYCVRNPKPCPLLHVLEKGVWEFYDKKGGELIDIRKDLPKYRVYKDGVLQRSASGDTEISEIPQELLDQSEDEFVVFVIGCSFSFEEALLKAQVSQSLRFKGLLQYTGGVLFHPECYIR
jgi:uncharacterized protein YcsI (UPF0317 family)